MACITPYSYVYPSTKKGTAKEVFKARCRKCLPCQQFKQNEWALRLYHESTLYDLNHVSWLGLSYNDDNLPSPTGDSKDLTWRDVSARGKTFKIPTNATLVKKDIQSFMKNLRNHFTNNGVDLNLRYFASGEYGELHGRPHYHMLIFGLNAGMSPFRFNTIAKNFPNGIPFPISDTLFREQLEAKKQYLQTKALLEKVWGKGYVKLYNIDIAGGACIYTSKYMLEYSPKSYYEKKNGDVDCNRYNKRGQLAPFQLMSLKPAIGIRWLQKPENERVVLENVRKGIGTIEMPPNSRGFRYKVFIPDMYLKYLCRDGFTFYSSTSDSDTPVEIRYDDPKIAIRQLKRLFSVVYTGEMYKKSEGVLETEEARSEAAFLKSIDTAKSDRKLKAWKLSSKKSDFNSSAAWLNGFIVPKGDIDKDDFVDS